MNTTSKFVVLSALAVLMVGATMVLAVGNADASRGGDRERNVGDRNIGLQNTGDTSSGDVNSDNDGDVEGGDDASSGDANGGNFVEGDFNCDECNTGDEED
jgi:hypothetical protein